MEVCLHRCKLAAIIYFLLALPLSFVLPEWLAWENGPIEIAQDIVLFAGVVLTLSFYLKGRPEKKNRFWLPVSGYFLILLGRELSWGRVFFMKKMTEHGPVFISMHSIPYQKYIHGGITVFIVIIAVSLLLTLPWKQIFRNIPFPWSVLALMGISAVLAALGDKGLMTQTYIDENIEELAELLVYLLNIYFAVYYHYWLNKINHT